MSVNTPLETSTDCKVNDWIRQRFIKCFYTNATSLNNKFDEFIEEINDNEA